MKNNVIIKKVGLILGSFLLFLYILFLIIPFILSPFVNSYSTDIENLIKEMSGLNSKIENINITTSLDLKVGVKIGKFSLFIPEKENIIEAKKVCADIKLLPLILKKVQFGRISAKSLKSNIVIKKDGGIEFIDYVPQVSNEQEPMKSLPYGFILSNNLANINVENYSISLIDANDNKKYSISGKNFKISDFVLDKKIKLSTVGKIVFDNRVVSNYDIKIFNKIMPDLSLDDIVFPKEVLLDESESTMVNIAQKANPTTDFNICDIFKAINKNLVKADVLADIKTSGTFKNPIQNGYIKIENFSVARNNKPLPESYIKLLFKGSKSELESVLYSSFDKNEKTIFKGVITSGRSKNIDLNLVSNARFNNLIRLVDSIAQSFGKDDFKSLTATGGIDANLNIKSDFKTLNSNGYLKINPSSINYSLYNVVIDKIVSDIDCKDNNIKIQNTGFSINGHPLTLVGTISKDALADLKLNANKLSIKGLLVALGQVSILKENNINRGDLSIDILAKGKLNSIKPDINLNISGVDVYNSVAKLKLLLSNAVIKLNLLESNFSGDIDIKSLVLKNADAMVSIPSSKIVMDTKDIIIKGGYVLLNNSKVNVSGFVKNYLNDNMDIKIKAAGNLASKDIAAFIPSEFRSMFPYKGVLPISIVITGDSKVQNILLDINANPQNYIQLVDINLLKGKNTKIHSQINLVGNNIKLSNTGIYANDKKIVSISGGVNNISSPDLNISVDVADNISFPIWGMSNSNITLNGNISISGNLTSPKIKGKVNVSDISIKDMGFELINLVANLNGSGISGHANAEKMRFDNIVATNLSSKFLLNNYTDFYLNDISATAYSGKVTGKIYYNIPKFAFNTDLQGKGMNSMDSIYAAVAIPKALTGTLGFSAKLSGHGVTDIDIIKSLKGSVEFNIEDGRFVSIGKLENLFAAQNIVSNSLLKTAISQLTTLSSLQESDKFKYISGDLNLSDGSALINQINISGPLMAYYIKGKYYVLPNSANLSILGRLDSKVVSFLGPLGQLSADKLLAYIPKFGTSTAQLLKQITSNPETEKTELIPPLSSGSSNYKDFKVVFNGPVEKSSSIKSFKWLSNCDTSEINIKEELKNAQNEVKNNIENSIKDTQTKVENVKNNVNNTINSTKQQVDNTKKSIEQTKQDIQNAKNNAKQTVTNLGNLFKNAALNSQNKVDTKTEESSSNKTEGNSQSQTTTQEVTQETQTEIDKSQNQD